MVLGKEDGWIWTQIISPASLLLCDNGHALIIIFSGCFILFMLQSVYNIIVSHKDIFIFYLAKQIVNFLSLTFRSYVLALCLFVFFAWEKQG